MAEQSFTGIIDTNGEYADLASTTSLTFTDGITYTIYIGGQAQVKVADAEFPVSNERIYFTPSGSGIYIKNISNPMNVTIYGGQ